jgi:hypothetical protein
MEKKLGKLENVEFGLGGYQDACIGLSVTISGDGWGVSSNKSAWDSTQIVCSDSHEWTEEDRSKQYDEIMRFVSGLLSEAKVKSVSQLNGTPVEAEFSGMELVGWRVLTEVI